MRQREVEALAKEFRDDAQLMAKLQGSPEEAIREAAKRAASPLETDVWIYRLVVLFLGVTMLFAIAAVTYLAAGGNPSPDGIVALGSAAVGALAGLLAPSPIRER